MIKKENLFPKIIAVLIAIALWFYVTSEQNPNVSQTVQNVPLKVQNLGSGLAVTDISTQTVTLRVRGRTGILSNLDNNTAEAFVNLEGVQPGKRTLPVEVTIPTNLEIIEIIPDKVKVTIEPVVKKALPIQAELHGNTSPGMAPLPPTLLPDRVSVQGAASLIKKAQTARISLNVDKLSAETTEITDVKIFDINGQEVIGLSIRPQRIKAVIPVVPTKTVPIDLRTTGTPAAGYKLVSTELRPTTVTLKGRPEDMANLTKVSNVPVDLNGATGNFTVQLALNLPTGVYLADPALPELKVTIQPIQGERTFTNLPVAVQGKPDNTKVSLTPGQVDFTLTGPQAVLSRLTPADLQPVVDVAGLGVGEHRLPVQAKLPGGVDFKERVTILVKISR